MREDLTPARRAMLTPYVRLLHLMLVIRHPRLAWYDWRTRRAYVAEWKRLGINPTG